MKNSKNIQEPQNHHDDHDRVQDGFNGSRHWDESINQPKENANHDQNHNQLD